MLESGVEQDVLYKGVIRMGGLCYKIVPYIAGLPDRLILLPGGRVHFVEMKKDPTEDLRPDQKLIRQKWAQRGTIIHVLKGPEQTRSWLKEQEQ